MADILIKTDSHYKVNRGRIRKLIENFLGERKVRHKVEVSLSVVGDRQMKKLNNDYRKLDMTTDVLSFPLSPMESGTVFVDAPDNILRLGDIVISYPQVIESASEEDKLVDDKIDELIIHGLKHLLGQHHE
ncbi:MAG: hypothetical protein UV73_C0007G0045 [Candidatus Gottesmanbacteria bacterium GW2011_GWA2_43_14]|uniref:rRNA maturation RNase YbeY n=1 Tax=Candidatus Gottesmanbacteria bacterium GW2011_GWA2_43_14 TaxID=1618443 RepID=A0A0G1DJ55_9BACT|nr:MAG: hypothetical protein UV73_C0007G0045 [Candidatus Gottesmanbacteria bacterium GW2011_GWA2_43_14]